MADLFDKKGAFDKKELKEFIELYQQYGKYDWDTKIDLGDDVSLRIQNLVNDMSNRMAGLTDRLALTILELSKKPKQHSGDCTIYASLINNRPEDGICICGYGLHAMRETGNNSELYSEELKHLIEERGLELKL
jgi:hypothetical protein